MKNIISIMLFVVAFTINANAQETKNPAAKESCCVQGDKASCCPDMSACDYDYDKCMAMCTTAMSCNTASACAQVKTATVAAVDQKSVKTNRSPRSRARVVGKQ